MIDNLKDVETISWIFMATAIASETEPTDFNSISVIADGINHAIPTYSEMHTSLTWLSTNGLLTEDKEKYTLTPKGKSEYQTAAEKTNTMFKILDNLIVRFKTYA